VIVSPLISVALAVRNADKTLTPAVTSIMLQDCADWELLVFDDGSTDGTHDIIRDFKDPRIRFHSDGRKLGLGARLNDALAIARAPFFARMDADDIAYPHRFSTQLAYLQARPDVDLAGAGAAVFGESGTVRGARRPPERHEEICARPYSGFAMIHPTYFGRTEWFRSFGYDPTMLRAQDQELLLRSYRTSRFANVPELLLGYREEKASFRKAARGRALYLERLSASDEATRGCSRSRATGLTIAKIIVDAAGALPGGSIFLRHRTPPISNDEALSFRSVWTACQEESHRCAGSTAS
jgi:glycosyltransferase involved in cell wall biosynthesis